MVYVAHIGRLLYTHLHAGMWEANIQDRHPPDYMISSRRTNATRKSTTRSIESFELNFGSRIVFRVEYGTKVKQWRYISKLRLKLDVSQV